MRQEGEQVEQPRRRRLLHLRAISTLEPPPHAVVMAGLQGLGNERCTRREIGQPCVVPVLRGMLAFRDAARRAAHGAEARPLVGVPRGSEPNDTNGQLT